MSVSSELSKEELLKAYRMMRTIREFEERLHVEFATGEIPGFVHLYAGEEAIATGIVHASPRGRPDRQHAPGPRPLHRQGRRCARMMAEIYGRKSGTVRRQGRLHAHRGPVDKGMMGANGIVGGGPPLVCGAALAAKRLKSGGVAVASSGTAAPIRAPPWRA